MVWRATKAWNRYSGLPGARLIGQALHRRRPLKRTAFDRPNKFFAIKSVYGGHLYHSQAEARYAAQLDLEVRAGKIKAWRRQVPVKLMVDGVKIGSYIVDFVAEYHDGHECWIEVKGGKPTPLGAWKIKHFKAQFPEREYKVVNP